MLAHTLLVLVLGLTPVVLFLLTLVYLDSFKLVSLTSVIGVMALGCLAGIGAYLVSGPVMDWLHVDFQSYSRYAAPFVEEFFKCGVMVYLLARNRVGFMVDAAIMGVAIGAGFALFENVYYAGVFPDASPVVFLVRGLGTAIMHGGTTAIFAVMAQSLSERRIALNPLYYIPGLIAAIALHAGFNQFTQWPLQSTAVTIFALPFALLLVFNKSEHKAHDWLIHDYESHEHLLEAIRDGTYAHGPAGRFISDIAVRLPKTHTEDIFAYVSLHTQLVLRAEQLLLARESGERNIPLSNDHEKFERLHALEQKIGKTAMLTIWPHLQFSHQELWELHQLEDRA